MTQAKFKFKNKGREKPCHSQNKDTGLEKPVLLLHLASCRNIQKIHLFLFLKLAELCLKDERGMKDQEERMKNKKYRYLKMFQSDIILKFKNLIKININQKIKI